MQTRTSTMSLKQYRAKDGSLEGLRLEPSRTNQLPSLLPAQRERLREFISILTAVETPLGLQVGRDSESTQFRLELRCELLRAMLEAGQVLPLHEGDVAD